MLGLSPQRTLDIAQELYTNSLISYPRTSSQKLPESIGYKKILQKLSRQFPEECSNLLAKQKLLPNNGPKDDAAHPGLFPTGESPKGIDERAYLLYELITRRFFATFGDSAIRETMTVVIDVNNEPFITTGTTTKERGWHALYGRFLRLKEEELPRLNVKDEINETSIKLHDKETKPPARYNEASIIKAMESVNIGTKCITEDTLVAFNDGISSINSNFVNDFAIDQIDNCDILLNQNRKVFGFYAERVIKNNYLLSSRRMIKSDETVHKLMFTDGSNIKVTSSHPLLIHTDNGQKYRLCADIKPGEKIVSAGKLCKEYPLIVSTWELFIDSPEINYFYGTFNLKSYRLDKGATQRQLANELGTSQDCIYRWEKCGYMPIIQLEKIGYKPDDIKSRNNVKIPNPFPLQWSSQLASLLGNLLGDGSLDKLKLAKENCYDFRYTNTDLVRKFIERVYEIFRIHLTFKTSKLKTEVRKTTYYVKVPSLVGRMLATMFNQLKTKDAPIIPVECYPEFLGALFDDEGHCNEKEAKLFISNTNIKLLQTCQMMLKSLKIESCLHAKAYKLDIYGKYNLLRFLSKIPISSITKKQKLIRSLSTHYNYGSAPQISLEKKLVCLLANDELTMKELCSQLIQSTTTITTAIKDVNKNGLFIDKKIIPISKQPRKLIKYYLKNKSILSLYSQIDEEIINEEFITKTVYDNQIVKYDGYVYDITNRDDIPNFILENGVVVHNSTRSTVLQNLYDRNYIADKLIRVTDLGTRTIETLEKYCPEVLDAALTRKFEEEMESIQEGKKKGDEVIEEAKELLTGALDNFKKNEKEIGKELGEAVQETRDKESFIGKCPVCKEGDLQMRRGKYGMFAACNRYEKGCSTTFALPKNALVKGADKNCEICNYPKILAIKARRKPQELCINSNCPSKKQEEEKMKELAKDKKCPHCGSQLVVKSSVYGSFLACPGYPKCKHIEKITSSK